MALTIRTSEVENEIIEKAMVKFGINTRSKTLIECVSIALTLHDYKKQLEKELKMMKRKFEVMNEAFEAKKIADLNFERVLKEIL